MVTQQDGASQSGLEAPREEGLLPTVIYNEVSDEERAAENKAFNDGVEPPAPEVPVADAPSEAEPVVADESGEAPDQQPPQVQEVEPQPTVEVTPDPEPQPRVFTQEEVSKMQSAWSKQIEAERQRAQEAASKVAAYDLESTVEATLRQQEQQYVAEYGPEGARNIVRTETNIGLIRSAEEAKQQVAQAREVQKTAATQAELQAKNTVAQQLMQQHRLGADDYELLLSAADPNGMVALASRLAANQQVVAREQKKALVPAETARTQLESGPSGGGAESEQQKTNRIYAKDSRSWTAEEAEHMRRLAYG